MSLDFIRDLIRGELDPKKEYPAAPAGLVGMARGEMSYFAKLADGIRRNNVGTAGITVLAQTEVKDGKVVVLPTGQSFALEGKAPADPLPRRRTLKVHGWDAGWRSAPYRHSANTIYVVMQGEGSSAIAGRRFDWAFGDTLAAPAWSRIEHQAGTDSVLFAMSDEALMRWARYYRFESLG